MDEQSLSGDGVAIPLGMGTDKGRELAGPPAPLVLGEPAGVVVQLQEGHAQIEVGLGVVGLELDGALVIGDRFPRPALSAGEVTETIPGLGALGLGLDHRVQTGDGLR
jgi:hypothetical protein